MADGTGQDIFLVKQITTLQDRTFLCFINLGHDMTGNFCGKCFYNITRQDIFLVKEKNHWEGEQLGHIVLTLHIIVDILLFHDFWI